MQSFGIRFPRCCIPWGGLGGAQCTQFPDLAPQCIVFNYEKRKGGGSNPGVRSTSIALYQQSYADFIFGAGLQEYYNDVESILPQYIGILLTASHLGGRPRSSGGDCAARDGPAGLRPLGPSLAARSLPLGAPLAWQDEQNPLPFGKMQAMLHFLTLGYWGPLGD